MQILVLCCVFEYEFVGRNALGHDDEVNLLVVFHVFGPQDTADVVHGYLEFVHVEPIVVCVVGGQVHVFVAGKTGRKDMVANDVRTQKCDCLVCLDVWSQTDQQIPCFVGSNTHSDFVLLLHLSHAVSCHNAVGSEVPENWSHYVGISIGCLVRIEQTDEHNAVGETLSNLFWVDDVFRSVGTLCWDQVTLRTGERPLSCIFLFQFVVPKSVSQLVDGVGV